VTVLYYLGPGTSAHTEIRYVLPMHGVLIVFAGFGVDWIAGHNKKVTEDLAH